MKQQIVISAAFRHADLSTEKASGLSFSDRHERAIEVFNTVFENLPIDHMENIAIYGDSITYSKIVEESRTQAAITSRVVSLPDEFQYIELLGFHSVAREAVDQQYRKFLTEEAQKQFDNEKQKEETSKNSDKVGR